MSKAFENKVKLNDFVSVKDFGAVGDGVADDSAALLLAKTYCASSGAELYCPAGLTIYLGSSVDLTGVKNIDIRSNILIPTGTITIGGLIDSGSMRANFADITNGTSTLSASPPASPVLRIVGINNSTVTVGACNYIQLYADDSVTAKRLCAYNSFYFNGPTSLLEITDAGGATSYVNENWIYATRVIRYSIIKVGYAHNHNKLINPTFEGSSVAITITGGTANQIYGARFEGATAAPGVTFDSASYSNTIISTWSGAGNPRGQFSIPIPVSDSGMGNMVTTEAATQFRKTTLFSLGIGSTIIGTATDTITDDPRIAPKNPGIDNIVTRVVLEPGLAGVSPATTNRYIAISDMVPVSLGDVIVWDADFDGSLVRQAYFVYDADMEPILSEGVGGAYVSQPGLTFSTTYGRYAPGADQSVTSLKTPCAIIRSEVKFIRVAFYLGTVGLIRNLSASLFSQSIGRGTSEGAGRIRDLARVIDGAPTKGYAPLNYMVFDKTAKVMRWVSYQYENKVSGALSAGATSVTVSAIDTVANSDICGILMDNKVTHWSAVSGLAGSTFTITAIPAGRSVPDGARIVFNRWAS